MPADQMLEVTRSTDYSKYQDGTLIDRLDPLGQGLSLLFQKGIYEGNYLKEYLGELLPGRAAHRACVRLGRWARRG